ncbi:putative membrane protein [Fontibacillus phaseoli]|uniref:Putative membrane protein n=1 Tax=Fontibacillus phaseoli TaxID=1416533 RepID=A0A369BF62_9BACL|nr:DUF1700 domain-containing protein [Fontibacillus phaseoli]RCX19196.1 putative membrane protein [Fontibacillus phaseoli]
MNKSEFLAQLHDHLSVLPPEERNELMEDFEAHFTFALQNGKSEEEIASELGNPAELAKEAIDGRFAPKEPVYWFNPDTPPAPPAPENPKRAHRRSGFATTMVYIGLIFLNMIAVPLLLSAWAVGVSVAAVAIGGLISPLALGLDYLAGNGFFAGKSFAVVSCVGVGILFALASRYVFKLLIRISNSYWAWNVRVGKGGEEHE